MQETTMRSWRCMKCMGSKSDCRTETMENRRPGTSEVNNESVRNEY